MFELWLTIFVFFLAIFLGIIVLTSPGRSMALGLIRHIFVGLRISNLGAPYIQKFNRALLMFIGLLIILANIYIGIFALPGAISKYSRISSDTISAGGHPCEVCGQPAKLVEYVRRRGATFVGIATHWYCDKHTGSTPYDDYKTSVFGGYIMLIVSMFTVLAVFHATKIEGENIKGLWLFLLVSGFFSVLTWYLGARLNY